MVLHPLAAGATLPSSDFQPAGRVIERTQKQVADSYWLVTQPDHATLAGALAGRIVSPEFPIIEASAAHAIAVHDAGWAIFDAEANVMAMPALDDRGTPLSFLEIEPPQFLRAWTASIERAAGVFPAGGYIVSQHFCALGEGRLAAAIDVPENSARLRSFLNQEAERRERLMAEESRSQEELDSLLLVLQFCDLVSLYLCCGAASRLNFRRSSLPARSVCGAKRTFGCWSPRRYAADLRTKRSACKSRRAGIHRRRLLPWNSLFDCGSDKSGTVACALAACKRNGWSQIGSPWPSDGDTWSTPRRQGARSPGNSGPLREGAVSYQLSAVSCQQIKP